jgi:hypothetical protein
MAKESLRRAFAASGVRWWDSPRPPDSHGEFGTVVDWGAREASVIEWLRDSEEIESIADVLAVGSAVDAELCGNLVFDAMKFGAD